MYTIGLQCVHILLEGFFAKESFSVKICSNDLYSELFSKVLLKLFEVLDFSRNRGQFENRHFSIAAISEKKL